MLALPASAAAAGRCGDHPWCDTSLSPGVRADLLLGEMTLEEKISLMAGDDLAGVFTGNPATGTSDGIPRLDIPTVYYSDGPVGPREGRATAMPGPLALASGFDPELARAVGVAIANEVKNKGNDVVHAPTVDIMRTPLAGRTFEGYGEDPFLASALGVAWVQGAQSEGVIANVKHYAPNSQEGQVGAPPLGALVGGRFTVDAVVDERTLREIYLPPFEDAITRGDAGSVMCAYNRINGFPACESPELLQRILRRDWGFDGFVLADYGFAQKSTVASANNGLDLEMPIEGWYSPLALGAAVSSGQVSETTIDERVGNILRTMFRFGLFDREPYPSNDGLIDVAAHAAIAQRVEEQGIVLLENDGALPLEASRLRSIAIVGADAMAYKGGGGSSAVRPFSFTSPRDAIAARAGPGVEIRYDPGRDAGAAATAARGADVALVFVSDHTTEGADKPCIALRCAAPDPAGGGQPGTAGRPDPDALIDAVAAANPNTVVVLETGGPVLTPWVDKVSAVVEAWYPGQEAGAALARVLFGDADPGGRLPVTFPVSEGDIPAAGNPRQYPGVLETAEYSEGVFAGYRHYDERGITPRWPFGHGLSYTSFVLRGLRVEPAAGGGPAATVGATVTNTGSRAGVAVPQLYVGHPSAGVPQPPRQLKGFRKLALGPGESTRVRFRLDRRAFAHWDVAADDWAVAPGCYGVFVGRSSRDLPLRGTVAQSGLPASAARPVGRGVRFSLGGHGGVDVDVLKVARGSRVLRARRVVRRFSGRRASFTWNGRGAGVTDGWYVARIRLRGSGGGAAVRRFALERRRGRFRRRPSFARGPSCDPIRRFSLSRPVFGGRRGAPLGIAVRVSQRARVSLTARRGRRVVRRFRARTVPAGRTRRLRLPAAGLPRGRYTIRVAARRGGGVVRAALGARRL